MGEIKRRIRKSQRQERDGMAELGGSRHRGSGNGARKGDGRTENELVEFKRTDAKQITLKLSDLKKIGQEAALTGRTPLLMLEMGGRTWVVMEHADWMEQRNVDQEADGDAQEADEAPW
jgi:Holliday junction resolvase